MARMVFAKMGGHATWCAGELPDEREEITYGIYHNSKKIGP